VTTVGHDLDLGRQSMPREALLTRSVALSNDSYRVAIIDPTSDRRWDEFVLGHPHGMIFHRSQWAQVLIESYAYIPRYYVLETESGALAAAWPAMLVNSRLTGKRLVSLPFSDHYMPLVHDAGQSSQLWAFLLADASELGVKRIEVRGWPDGIDCPPVMVPVHGYVRHVIDLSVGLDSLRNGLSENARRSIKRAQKDGVTTRVADGVGDIDTFIELNLKLRRSHGMLPQPRRFFDAINRHMIQSGLGYLLLTEREGASLAALLLLRHNNMTLDKYAVNDSRLREYRGSHAVMWKAIEIETERGSIQYDLGRSDATAASLHRFKEQWGAVSVDASYLYYPKPGGQNTADPSGLKKSMLDAFARFAPDHVYSAAGNIVYRHLG
jgi:hypothetical protein